MINAGGMLPPVVLEIVANIDKLKMGVDRAKTELDRLDNAGVSSASKFGGAFKAGMALAATAVIGFATIAAREAMEAETVMADLRNNIKTLGQSAQTVIPQVEAFGQAMVNLGFDDEDATAAFIKLNTALKDSKAALQLSGMAADLARKKHVTLEDAARMLAMATTGTGRAFKEFGIKLDTTIKDPVARVNKAFFELQERLDGTADAFADTAAGRMEIFKQQANNVMQELGDSLLPVLKMIIGALSKFAYWAKENAGILKGVLLGAIAAVTLGMLGLAAANVAAFWELYLGVAVLAAVAAGFMYAWNNSEGFRKGMISLGKSTVAAYTMMGQTLIGFVQVSANATDKLLGGLAAVASAMGNDEGAARLNKAGDEMRKVANDAELFEAKMLSAKDKFDKLAESKISNFRFKFSVDQIKDLLKDPFTGLTSLGSATNDAAKSGSGDKMADSIKEFSAQLGKYKSEFGLYKEQVEGNLTLMKELATSARSQAADFMKAARALEVKTRNTKNHAAAMKALATATTLAASAQAYQNEVNKKAAEAAEATSLAIDGLTNTYARNNSYLASINRLSGAEQRSTFIEVPVIIDGQVLFRVNQKAALTNNRRNSTNGLARSGSVI